MKLEEAFAAFEVPGMDGSKLVGQEEAFQNCLAFLDGIEKVKHINQRYGSYRLKHLVEDPAALSGMSTSQTYTGYVYEGTFILAALASGFECEFAREGMDACFNISARSLRQKLRLVGRKASTAAQ